MCRGKETWGREPPWGAYQIESKRFPGRGLQRNSQKVSNVADLESLLERSLSSIICYMMPSVRARSVALCYSTQQGTQALQAAVQPATSREWHSNLHWTRVNPTAKCPCKVSHHRYRIVRHSNSLIQEAAYLCSLDWPGWLYLSIPSRQRMTCRRVWVKIPRLS